MKRFLAALGVLVTVSVFGAIAGTGTVSAHHGGGECERECGPPPQQCEFGSHTVVDTAAYDEEVQVPDGGHWEGEFPHKHFVTDYKTVIVHHDAVTHEECNPPPLTPCAEGQYGENVETTGCFDPVSVCQNGVIVDGLDPRTEPTDTGDCGPAEYCHDGQVVQGIEFEANTLETGDCGTTSLCVNGDIVTGVEFDLNQLGATNDCNPVRLCLTNGESATVTKFDAESLLADGATKGSCTPSENPPPTVTTTTTVTETIPQPVEQVETAVSDVSPAVDEVAVLPSTGYGETGSSFNWTALAAIVFIGIGASTVLVARRHA
jgi:hypothetical protein